MARVSYTDLQLAATALSRDTRQVRGLAGSFSLMPLGELVDFLGRRQVTGSLTAERGTIRKTVFLRDGHAVGAASTDPREFLGQFLINFGHLDEEQLAKAFRTQQETKVRLGKVLAMVGLVPPAIVRDVVVYHATGPAINDQYGYLQLCLKKYEDTPYAPHHMQAAKAYVEKRGSTKE